MLRRSEKERLAQLAKAQNVSTAEIICRAIVAYEPDLENQQSLAVLTELLKESTDKAIGAVDRAVRQVEDARQVVRDVLR
jgi:hypothetical protein